jgi:general nucleoside transport system ATP-binding protein
VNAPAVDALAMRGITKWYPSSRVLANDRVDFSARSGEIHALVGENGAGKSTLVRILNGDLAADAGTVSLDGRAVTIRSPRDAMRHGIGMVHQHFRLVPLLTVAENVVLGREPTRARVLFDETEAILRTAEAGARYGLPVEPGAAVADLDVGTMQQVELIKLLYRDARILILDEPTAVLTDQQTDALFATLRSLAGAGRAVIIVTHSIEEVLAFADRVTVLRGGRVVAMRETAGCTPGELAALMVGSELPPEQERTPARQGRVVLELEQVTVQGRYGKGLQALDLAVHAGEIVGVTALAGNGLRELEDVVAGLRVADGGRLLYQGRPLADDRRHAFRRRELAYVPSQRFERGASLTSTVEENMILGWPGAFGRLGLARRAATRCHVLRLMDELAIDGTPELRLEMLSGGNRQKVILARELGSGKDCVLFAEPTWGIDVAATRFVHGRILELRDAGRAVLLLSSDPEEILRLADSIVVLREGRAIGRIANGRGLTRRVLGEYMLGLREDAA